MYFTKKKGVGALFQRLGRESSDLSSRKFHANTWGMSTLVFQYLFDKTLVSLL